jgi:hypothetical protein
VSFANLSEVQLRNAKTGTAADPFRMTADGSWGGFVKLGPGQNTIEVTALADDGAQSTRSLNVVFEPEAPEQSIPRELMTQRNRLLEDCLLNLKQVRMKVEDDRNQKVRRDLKLEIERERAKARQRAADQSKQLDIQIEEEEGENIEN